MKILIECTLKINTIETMTYRVGVKNLIRDCMNVIIEALGQVNSLWSSTMNIVESGGFCKDALFNAGKTIQQTMGWSDPVDALLVHVYTIRIQHEEVVKDKPKKDNANEGSLKKLVRRDPQKQFRYVKTQ